MEGRFGEGMVQGGDAGNTPCPKRRALGKVVLLCISHYLAFVPQGSLGKTLAVCVTCFILTYPAVPFFFLFFLRLSYAAVLLFLFSLTLLCSVLISLTLLGPYFFFFFALTLLNPYFLRTYAAVRLFFFFFFTYPTLQAKIKNMGTAG